MEDSIVVVSMFLMAAIVIPFSMMYLKSENSKAEREVEFQKSLSPKLRREMRINILIKEIGNANLLGEKGKKKLLEEELNILKKEREKEDIDILDSAYQNQELVLKLKKEIEDLKGLKLENEKLAETISRQKQAIKEIEDLKGLKLENEKLAETISQQKQTISDLEMEIKILKSANEKLVY